MLVTESFQAELSESSTSCPRLSCLLPWRACGLLIGWDITTEIVRSVFSHRLLSSIQSTLEVQRGSSTSV